MSTIRERPVSGYSNLLVLLLRPRPGGPKGRPRPKRQESLGRDFTIQVTRTRLTHTGERKRRQARSKSVERRRRSSPVCSPTGPTAGTRSVSCGWFRWLGPPKPVGDREGEQREQDLPRGETRGCRTRAVVTLKHRTQPPSTAWRPIRNQRTS